ncbi:MAG: DAK2 domain-containing protein [Mycoplasmataceae bacterium]|nr:DAK2 domain-containing protein [Mycoplasmataceae bacterium]
MKNINGLKFKEMLRSGVNNLSNNKDRIDSLNVFPVPDGDTGSNMGETVEYAFSKINDLQDLSISSVSAKFSKGMLMGARGNSGVILSQIFKGLSIAFKSKKTATSFDIVEAFKIAKEYAYKSVMKPVEGTILTVIRVTAEDLSKNVTPSNTVIETFKMASDFSAKATETTPELLPVLKEVGVVDSGGEGLRVFIEGMYLELMGKPVKPGETAKGSVGTFDMISDDGDGHGGEYGYCTEFILDLKLPKNFNKEKFQTALMRFGGSMVIVQDDNIVKVHIHSMFPGKVLTFSIKFGQFLKTKIDNMTLQANESNNSRTSTSVGSEVTGNIAIISCNTGQGIIDEMISLGVNFVIEAGQSANPSASDFINAIEELAADKVFLLPNNSNIIMAAQQAAQTSEKEVHVIPSKTQMQGISAMINFDPEGTIEDNKINLEEALEAVCTGQVTRASKTTKIEGVSVKYGEFLSIADKKILGSEKSKVAAAIEISKKLIDEDTEIVTIYYGDDSTESDAKEVASHIEMNYDAETEVKRGDQAIYNFLISYE